MIRLQAGNDRAWTEWFDDAGPRVWKYVARLTGADSAAVADTVQEVFLAAADGISSFDSSRGPLTSWLLGIAHRKAALFWRRKSREADIIESLSKADISAVFEENHDSGLQQEDLSAAVRSVVARMPEESAAVLICHYLEDQSTSELAEELGITEQAVRSRLSRARQRFRELFEVSHRELV